MVGLNSVDDGNISLRLQLAFRNKINVSSEIIQSHLVFRLFCDMSEVHKLLTWQKVQFRKITVFVSAEMEHNLRWFIRLQTVKLNSIYLELQRNHTSEKEPS